MNRKFFYQVFLLVSCGISLCRPVHGQIHTMKPALADTASWTMVLMPDPQGYTKFKRNQPILDVMTNWVMQHRQELNVRLLMCTGDLVEHNFITEVPEENGDQLSGAQWKSISMAFNKFDGVLPYILCTGNHDYTTSQTGRRYTQFNSFFPPDRNPLNKAMIIDMAPNEDGIKTLENVCYEFKTPHGNSWLIFSLEYVPRPSVVTWARELAEKPQYRHHTGVVLTHSYMRSGLRGHIHIEKEDYPTGFHEFTTGSQLWQQLIYPSSIIRLVICGHVVDHERHEGQVGFRTDNNHAGKPVHQMLFNAQNAGGNWKGNGGDGWIRLLEFLPDGETVRVKTYSPLFDLSPSTKHLARRTETFDEFSFRLSR